MLSSDAERAQVIEQTRKARESLAHARPILERTAARLDQEARSFAPRSSLPETGRRH